MRPGYARSSLVLLAISILLLVILTIFESVLLGLSPIVERILTFIVLVVPAAAGAVFGALSLVRKEGQTWQAFTGLSLNSLFALFHVLIVLFAG